MSVCAFIEYKRFAVVKKDKDVALNVNLIKELIFQTVKSQPMFKAEINITKGWDKTK